VQFVVYSINDFGSIGCCEITTAAPRGEFLQGLLRTLLSSLNSSHSVLSVHCIRTKKKHLLVYDFTYLNCASYANFEKGRCLCEYFRERDREYKRWFYAGVVFNMLYAFDLFNMPFLLQPL
jgi:hypothetical protein